MNEPIKDCPQPESVYKPVTTVHGAASLPRRHGMNVPNRLRSNATAIRVRAIKLQDSVLKAALLAVADDLDEMRGLVLEHHDATAGVLGYRDDLHYQGLQDAFARVNGSQA